MIRAVIVLPALCCAEVTTLGTYTSSDTAAAAVPRPRVEVGRWALPEGADAVPADVTEVAEGTAVVLAAPEGGEGSS